MAGFAILGRRMPARERHRLITGMLSHYPFIVKNFRAYFGNLWRRKVMGSSVVTPYSAVFYATHKCNLDCSYCTQKNPEVFSEEVDTETTLRIFAKIRKDVDTLLITGGECLMRPDIEELVRRAKQEIGFRSVLVVTNGVLLDNRKSILPHLNGLIVSLDAMQHDPEVDGIARVGDAADRSHQARDVARVQADGGLVENVERSHQRGAELVGQVDALVLTAGERLGEAGEREVVQPHLVEECQARAYLTQHLARGVLLGPRELEFLKELRKIADGEIADLRDVLAADFYEERFGAKPLAIARGTREVALVAAQEHTHVDLVFFALGGGEEREHALEGIVTLQNALANGL